MKRRRWKIGNNAGWHWPNNGDLTVHTWVKSPRGEQMIMTTVAGFRDTPAGRRKCILDRYISPYPAPPADDAGAQAQPGQAAG